MKQTNPFYKSKRWEVKRKNILRRDQYECRQCRRYGKATAATMVHHCYPLETHPFYKLQSWNLISLCSKCHDKMHDRTNDELTKLGEEWKARVGEENDCGCGW
ncbi:MULTISPECIES: HNH endonuclease [Bacillus]|uniref:HNH endonuclease n=1 Tax=Bacillus TaxID=1386 RepID=UPI00057C2CD0|nr:MULTISPECIES: HNH endonuclease [Bacillus]AUZ29808.1 HNH endonuclease [Bacillus licheniformis]UAY70728.1 HNH endonuclease [Bacillus paralicheniformis]